MICIQEADSNRHRTTVKQGETIAQLLRRLGIDFGLPCGGRGQCGKCRVYVDNCDSPLSDLELKVLTGSDLDQGVRLACQTQARDGAVVRLPESQGDSEILDTYTSELVMGKPIFSQYGLAVDIGTTTLAAQLLDPLGTTVARETMINPQRTFGEDVISRIEYALAGGSSDLQGSVLEGINKLTRRLAGQANIGSRQIDGAVMAGNTTMLYLLTGRSPRPLASFPFHVDDLFGRYAEGISDNLVLSSDAKIYLPACMSAFVGADVTLAVWVSRMCMQDQPALLVDIGTNGEIAVWTGKELLSSSTAAGPAFEGVGISAGMLAEVGAIDTVSWDGYSLQHTVIGDDEREAVGICGSGVIDAIAVALDAGWLDHSGRLRPGAHLCVDSDVQGDTHSLALSLKVSLTQKDIRMVQLAKSAIRAGIDVLLKEAGMTPGQIGQIYLAGGFGQKMNVKNAIRIGLLPPEMASKIAYLGNASLAGCAGLLLDQEGMRETETIASKAHHENLATNPYFVEAYTDHMFFPHG